MLEKIADLHGIPQGAYNIRRNGEGAGRNTTANIDIATKTDKPGIDVTVKPHTKGESVHIPVIVTLQGIDDVVYNTFEIGEYSDVLVVAGCGIHNARITLDGPEVPILDGSSHPFVTAFLAAGLRRFIASSSWFVR